MSYTPLISIIPWLPILKTRICLVLPTGSRWQTKEELFHADKIYQYVNDRNGRVILEAIAAPPTTWNSLLTAFEDALKHEMESLK